MNQQQKIINALDKPKTFKQLMDDTGIPRYRLKIVLDEMHDWHKVRREDRNKQPTLYRLPPEHSLLDLMPDPKK